MSHSLVRDHGVLGNVIDARCKSERELARKAGLSPATVNHLVTGRRNSCQNRTAILIERALGVPAGTLFRRAER